VAEPYLRVVRGDATPEEVAALVATLAAVAAARARAADAARPVPVASNWNARTRLLRAPVRPAPGGWRRSALP
jgi:acyl-CoA carboxylase epsilon subunit